MLVYFGNTLFMSCVVEIPSQDEKNHLGGLSAAQLMCCTDHLVPHSCVVVGAVEGCIQQRAVWLYIPTQ